MARPIKVAPSRNRRVQDRTRYQAEGKTVFTKDTTSSGHIVREKIHNLPVAACYSLNFKIFQSSQRPKLSKGEKMSWPSKMNSRTTKNHQQASPLSAPLKPTSLDRRKDDAWAEMMAT
mmetsp:Transcript_28186/g.43859  ORF Transcript_28186/g.43859 Transcript_28186/m.43859 type:complete len:118 (-) Transcript_28186:638-991(-)